MAGALALFALALGASGDTATRATALVCVGAMGGAGLIIDTYTDAKFDHDPKKITVTLEPDVATSRQ